MLELGIMISVILFGPIIAIVIMWAIKDAKQLKANQISKEIISTAMRNVEDCNPDDLDAMIRYFEEQEEQVRYDIKD